MSILENFAPDENLDVAQRAANAHYAVTVLTAEKKSAMETYISPIAAKLRISQQEKEQAYNAAREAMAPGAKVVLPDGTVVSRSKDKAPKEVEEVDVDALVRYLREVNPELLARFIHVETKIAQPSITVKRP